MWMIALAVIANAAYCGLYAAFCARNKNALALTGAVLLALVPLMLFALCVISRAGFR